VSFYLTVTIGFEATTRGELDGVLHSFEELYEFLKSKGEDGTKLDRLARDKSIKKFFDKSDNNTRVFVNLSPLSANDAWFLDDVVLDNLNQVVLEITENNKFIITDRIIDRLKSLKNRGMLIALDDFGKDYSNFKLVYELEPDFIKLDKVFLENLESTHSRNIIRGMVHFTNQTNIKLIAEGVETEMQREILLDLGIRYMQGYYLGRPERIDKYFR
jgi:EAL domain-containing protein (putative c-di-GMP-specific phosphodiesterase class I)